MHLRNISLLHRYGGQILRSPGMQREKTWMQHGTVSVYRHSLSVALMCLALAHALRLRVNEQALVRGALLHDYFLYDWHEKDASHRWHGFTHPKKALSNARRDFDISPVEADMIRCHMFPMVPHMPRCRESALLCVADKLCAAAEVFGDRRKRLGGWMKKRLGGEKR